MRRTGTSSERAVIAVPVTVPYVRYSDEGAHWFIARALAQALAHSSLKKEDIDGLCLASFTLSPDAAVGITEHLGLGLRWFDHIPLGGAAGIVALRRARRAVESGDAQIVACIGADTNRAGSFHSTVAGFSRFASEAVYPYGAGGPNANFALLTAYYMRTYGARREDFGKLCIAQHENAANVPHALLREPLTMEQYLGARPIAEPLRLYDCLMPCAGAEGFLVMTHARARQLGLPCARVLSVCEYHNAFPDDPIQMRGGWALFRDELYRQAQVAPSDIDFVETYDDYPIMTLMQLEDLGFCAKGEGPQFLRSRSFTSQGSFPLNTSGGQLATGQAGAAGGFLGIVEAVRQLTHGAASPVPDAKLGIACGFGMVTYDRGLCSGAAILAREGA